MHNTQRNTQDNFVSQFDYWHHQYLLGNQQARSIFPDMLHQAINQGCEKASAIKKNIKSNKVKAKIKSCVKITKNKRYDTSKIITVVSPLYNYFMAYILMLLASMLIVAGGVNVI